MTKASEPVGGRARANPSLPLWGLFVHTCFKEVERDPKTEHYSSPELFTVVMKVAQCSCARPVARCAWDNLLWFFNMTPMLASEDPAFPGAKPSALQAACVASTGNGRAEALFTHERSQVDLVGGRGLSQAPCRSSRGSQRWRLACGSLRLGGRKPVLRLPRIWISRDSG